MSNGDGTEQKPGGGSGTRKFPAILAFLSSATTWGVAIVIAFLVFVVAVLWQSKRPIIEQLPDLGFARGIITLVFVLFTIGFAAIVLIHGLFVSEVEKDDRRFTRGREVLGLFVGIVGTIIGFYFGSAEKAATFDLAVQADRQADSKSILVNAHAIGGTPPYRFSAVVGTKKATEQSENGWFSKQFDRDDTVTEVTVEVSDAKDLRATKTVAIKDLTSPEKKAASGPQPVGSPPTANANAAPK